MKREGIKKSDGRKRKKEVRKGKVEKETKVEDKRNRKADGKQIERKSFFSDSP